MTKRNIINIFIDEIWSKRPMRKYPTYKIFYNHIDGLWSFDLAAMLDYKISNNEAFRFILAIIDNFSKCTWCIPLKNKKKKL